MTYAVIAAQARTHFVGTLVQMYKGVCKCRMEIITPKDSVGTLMELCQARRGDFIDMQFLTETRTTLIYELPLALVSLQPSLPPRPDLLIPMHMLYITVLPACCT